MTARTAFEATGDFFYGFPFEFYDIVGNFFNYFLIVVGFVGLFYWLNLQKKFDRQAENNPNQLR
jgi:hypothetical protein